MHKYYSHYRCMLAPMEYVQVDNFEHGDKHDETTLTANMLTICPKSVSAIETASPKLNAFAAGIRGARGGC